MADFVLVVLFVLAFLLGFVRGAVRQLVALGALLVAFILAAHLRLPVADWLVTQDARFSIEYGQMLGFVLVLAVIFGLALLVIQVTGSTMQVSSRPMVDDVLGGLLMLGVSVLAVASLLVALGTYFDVEQTTTTAEVGLVSAANAELEDSAIAAVLRAELVPGLVSLLGPLLPADVRDVF